jgi:hypothetical protein
MRALEVAEALLQQAPRPIVVNSQGEASSALSTLLLAQLLPDLLEQTGRRNSQPNGLPSIIRPLPEEE